MTEPAKPIAGQWDYSGAWDPLKSTWSRHSANTFSLGCFQWVPKSDGNGLKKGPVQKRFRGLTAEWEEVHRRAKAWCDERNKEQAQ